MTGMQGNSLQNLRTLRFINFFNNISDRMNFKFYGHLIRMNNQRKTTQEFEAHSERRRRVKS